jgi:hypothetical protein
VGFLNLFKRHDKLWINRRIRRMNLKLDPYLLGKDMAHTGVTDTASFVKDGHTDISDF